MPSAADASRAGMIRHQTYMDVVANNMANVNTTGYKRQEIHFQDILTTEDYLRLVRETGADVPLGTDAGVEVSAIDRVFSTGSLTPTGNPLDAAIAGEGLFQVQRPDGSIAYTRDGSFRLDAAGRITTADGSFLLGTAGPITVPAGARVSIDQTGAVVARVGDDGLPVTIANLELARFINPQGLLSAGQNQFVPSENSGPPILGQPGIDGFGGIVSGALEASNVAVSGAMSNLILAQRAFQVNLKAFETAEEMLRQANNLSA